MSAVTLPAITLTDPEMAPTGFPPVGQTLPAAVAHLVAALQPVKIILFGSYAHGTPTPDRDVDLLIIMETGATSFDRFRAVSRLLRPRDFPVDILVRTPAEIEAALQAGAFFIKEIIERGRVLYEHPT